MGDKLDCQSFVALINELHEQSVDRSQPRLEL